LRPANVTSIVPLNAILKNKGRDEW